MPTRSVSFWNAHEIRLFFQCVPHSFIHYPRIAVSVRLILVTHPLVADHFDAMHPVRDLRRVKGHLVRLSLATLVRRQERSPAFLP